MEKLPMCRICLVQNVRMYLVVNRNFHELYEKLTDIPFVTEDRRPILACFFCFAKLKQCCRFLRKCLEAEELFAQMMNEDYEPNPLINQDHLEYFGGFIKTPTENISIVDVVQTESIAIKEELPAVCEGLDDIVEPKEELQSDGATVAKKPKLDTRRIKLEDAITAEQTKKEKSDLKVIHTTHPGEKLKCDVRQRSFSQKSQLTEHSRKHPGEKPYKCNECQRSFSQKSHLTEHNRKHTGEKPYKCDECQRSFSRNSSLTLHIRTHSGDKPYKCDVCQRSFSQNQNLTEHIRLHTGEKPYKCNVCQRSFSQKTTLTLHSRIHTGEKPYQCDVCPRSFIQKIRLTHHIRIHTGEKPFKCDECQRSFSQKCNLDKHIRTHTGEKPYKCDECQRSFSQRGHLTSHIRMHTDEKSSNN